MMFMVYCLLLERKLHEGMALCLRNDVSQVCGTQEGFGKCDFKVHVLRGYDSSSLYSTLRMFLNSYVSLVGKTIF